MFGAGLCETAAGPVQSALRHARREVGAPLLHVEVICGRVGDVLRHLLCRLLPLELLQLGPVKSRSRSASSSPGNLIDAFLRDIAALFISGLVLRLRVNLFRGRFGTRNLRLFGRSRILRRRGPLRPSGGINITHRFASFRRLARHPAGAVLRSEQQDKNRLFVVPVSFELGNVAVKFLCNLGE